MALHSVVHPSVSLLPFEYICESLIVRCIIHTNTLAGQHCAGLVYRAQVLMIVNVKEKMLFNKYKSDVLWRWIYLHNESSYYAHLLESSAYNFQFSGRRDWGTNLKGFNREILLRVQKSIKVGVLQRVHNCRGGIDKKRSLIKAHLFLKRLSWDQANFFTI